MNHSTDLQLILVRGLPGSGKSTFARSFGYEHCETDEFFMVDGEYRFDPTKLSEAHAWCLARAGMRLRAGVSVVVSNTFTEWWEMAPYFLTAKECGARVFIVEMSGNYGSVHGVPEHTIQRMRDRWQSYVFNK